MKQLLVAIVVLFSFHAVAQQGFNDLEIVAFVARKSQDVNEFGDRSDWIEIRNSGSKELILPEVRFYLTDKAERIPNRFELPAKTLASGEVWRIWCDGENVYGNEVHTSFKLSKKGEHIGLFELTKSGELVEVTSWKYSSVPRSAQGFRKDEQGKEQPIPYVKASKRR
jgi:hypothetical protein